MKVGDIVNRKEELAEEKGAVIIAISEDGETVELQYFEGGTGFWPINSLEVT